LSIPLWLAVEGVTRKLLDGLIGAADFFEKLPTHTVQSPFQGVRPHKDKRADPYFQLEIAFALAFRQFNDLV
jgi:hypothetical protein